MFELRVLVAPLWVARSAPLLLTVIYGLITCSFAQLFSHSGLVCLGRYLSSFPTPIHILINYLLNFVSYSGNAPSHCADSINASGILTSGEPKLQSYILFGYETPVAVFFCSYNPDEACGNAPQYCSNILNINLWKDLLRYHAYGEILCPLTMWKK